MELLKNGDAGLDLSWTSRIKATIGSIIISKAANKKFEDALLKYQDKIIYHATCTGLGGTVLEPNVPTVQEKLNHLLRLLNQGFPATHIVIRIDPLFPKPMVKYIDEICGINYITNLKIILDFAEKNGIERIRYSYFDLYTHALKRLKNISRSFEIDKNYIYEYENEIQLETIKPGLLYSACAECNVPIWHKVGCISNEDLTVLGLFAKFSGRSNQRMFCLCPGNKFELLDNATRCEHKCAYCYWKDENEK